MPKTYSNLIAEISTTVLKNYIHSAGENIKAIKSSGGPISKIIKRSQGIKRAKTALDSPHHKFLIDLSNREDVKKAAEATKVGYFGQNHVPQHTPTMTPLELVNTLAKADPTHDHRYTPFLIKLYLRGEIRVNEDLPGLRNDLFFYEKNHDKFKIKDINSFKGKEDFYNAIEEVKPKEVISAKKQAKLIKQAGAVAVIDVPDFKVIQLKNFAAVKLYCSGTKWCFTGDYDTFKEYSRGLYVILTKIDGKNRKFAFHGASNQFMNERDIPISSKEIKALSEYKEFENLLDLISPRLFGKFSFAVRQGIRLPEKIEKMLPQKYDQLTKSLFKRSERDYYYDDGISDIPESYLEYAIQHKIRWPEYLERKIVRDSNFKDYEIENLITYIKHVIKGTFPAFDSLLEKMTAYEISDMGMSLFFEYATIAKKRFSEHVENILLSNENVKKTGIWDLMYIIKYVNRFNVGRQKNIEDSIKSRLKSDIKHRTEFTYRYLKDEAKDVLVYYTKYVPKEQWPEEIKKLMTYLKRKAARTFQAKAKRIKK